MVIIYITQFITNQNTPHKHTKSQVQTTTGPHTSGKAHRTTERNRGRGGRSRGGEGRRGREKGTGGGKGCGGEPSEGVKEETERGQEEKEQGNEGRERGG